MMGRPTRAASAVWWAPALFCTAEQNSSEVKGVRGSGMLGMTVLEDLSVRLFWKASRRGSFGGSLSTRRRSASASWARISLKTARWSFSIPKPKPVSGVSTTSFAGGGWGRWAAERAALRSALMCTTSDSNSLPHADPELRKALQHLSAFSHLDELSREMARAGWR